jgi:hypothetical protein
MATKKSSAKKINVRIGKRRKPAAHHKPAKRRRRPVSGFMSAPRKRKKTASVGAIKAGTVKQIGWMALGVAGGLLGTHFLLRPVERKLTAKWPKVGMALPTGEIFLGGLMALFSKNSLVKAAGVGILAGGVDGVFKQLKINMPTPALNGYDDGVSGTDSMDGYSDVMVPISGSFTEQIAGILEDSRRGVRTQQVAGVQNRTAVIADTVDGFEEVNDMAYVKF